MEKKTDDVVAVPKVEESQKKFPQLNGCSFDTEFYTPQNLITLENLLDSLVLPKRGKLSQTDKEREHSEEFVQSRRKHSAVESAINALENHSLDRCSDRGISGFKRYVAFAVLARNLQLLGHILQQKELKHYRKQEKLKHKKKCEKLCLAA